ncbi:TonB-dependent receptor [Pseudoalteromonas phenolica]|uniref:TonB-dependent receptor n=1 Tax=Pseudoalteromonas phenolica TaxID=161398 RepID=UPI00110A273C|nr:TonB-dependent receptor [Pseudoalteromonas phenolica]TMO54398.1 hypothetical protein CWC21_15810 [Pseudoalteromonas phenolica]
MKLSALSFALRASLAIPMALSSQLVFADDQGDEKEIETIMVTGQKVARSLQETTTSVAVLTPEMIEQQQINTFTDVMVNTANTHGDSYGFSIRGIDGFNVSGGGNSYLASVYIDGAPLPQGLVRNGGFSTWDAQQVEILRGPQSTLQGRNALAGAVILNTQMPSHENEGKYKLLIGQNGQQEAGIAIGGGLIEDELSFRFSGEEKRYDGNVINLHDNSDSDFNEEHTYRLKFLYEPAGFEDFSAMLSYMNAERVYGDANLTTNAGEVDFDNRTTIYNDTRERKAETELVSLTLSYDIDSELSFSSYTTYSDVLEAFDWDSDYPQGLGNTPIVDTGSSTLYDNTEKTLTQEFRLTFDYESFSGVAGAYYFNGDREALSNGLNNYNLSRLGLSSSVLQARYKLSPQIADLVIAQYADFDPARTQIYSLTETEVTSYALFADGVWHLNDQWDILAGVRFDREEQKNGNDAKYTILNQDKMPNPANYVGTPYEGIVPLITGINSLLLGLAADASKPAALSDTSFNTFLPKIGVSYHLNDDITSTFTFQKGYRSGGVGINQAKSVTFEYEPEYTDNYELAIRSTWLEGALTANANFFYTDWTDQQVSVQLSSNNFDLETVNAGSSEVKGFEFEVNYNVTDYLKAYAAIGYAGTEFTDFKITTPETEYDLTGRQFSAPERTQSAGLTYQGPEGLFANININYASDAPNRPNPYRDGLQPGDAFFDLHNDARTLVNFQLGYEWDNYGIYFIGKNITDEEYYVAHRARNARLGAPAEYAISFRGVFDW